MRKRKNSGKEWNEEEDNFLIKNVGRKSVSRIAKILHRSYAAVQNRMQRLNVAVRKKLTQEQKSKMQMLYKSMKIQDLARMMGVSESCVLSLARREKWTVSRRKVYVDEAGRKKYSENGNARNWWSPQMLDDMKRLFPYKSNKFMCEYLNVSSASLGRKARELGLKKDKEYISEICRCHAREQWLSRNKEKKIKSRV